MMQPKPIPTYILSNCRTKKKTTRQKAAMAKIAMMTAPVTMATAMDTAQPATIFSIWWRRRWKQAAIS